MSEYVVPKCLCNLYLGGVQKTHLHIVVVVPGMPRQIELLQKVHPGLFLIDFQATVHFVIC